ncbi:unnamed protein product [Rotaria magnacalcarata]|uniref:Uncharacterized protein n=1 Tax=Rotaria magnacalcarata TaxID=392030 RepID=A0A816VVW2_9BILA|nr:unnamed protein product [Rotaria magnacalcarata]CAF1639037.1 unnamed protein product [Rotaria magnacalcarata]CAF2119170.1 unnamed protein product [Rotaria magnacalcarata]CAF2127504.1 unnamed protein product [Rotaria magnacalcarata]
MPAITKDRFVKSMPTPARIYPRSLGTQDVKRLGLSRKISAKRTQTQSIQTQTVLACVILNSAHNKSDSGTQTIDDTGIDVQSQLDGFGVRLVKFLGGKLFSFMKLFNSIK